jgi:paraquat-inducible protein B
VYVSNRISPGHTAAKSLRDVSTAARSLRALTDYLERNPRAVIFGKSESKQD